MSHSGWKSHALAVVGLVLAGLFLVAWNGPTPPETLTAKSAQGATATPTAIPTDGAVAEMPARVRRWLDIVWAGEDGLDPITLPRLEDDQWRDLPPGGWVTTDENGERAKKYLSENKYFGKRWFNINVDKVSLLSVVGAGMMHKPGVAGLLFTTLGNAGINIRAISQGSSEQNITFVVSREDLKRAIQTIYSTFIDGNIPDKISRW